MCYEGSVFWGNGDGEGGVDGADGEDEVGLGGPGDGGGWKRGGLREGIVG